jgi:hypothetical protein
VWYHHSLWNKLYEYIQVSACGCSLILIGEKAVSLDNSQSYFLKSMFPEDVERARELIKTTFSRSDRFILREIDGDLWFINKLVLSKMISKNSNLNRFVVKKFKSKKLFIDHLQYSEQNLFEALDNRFVLIGIAFGYGEENARFYIRKIQLGEYLQRYPVISIYPFDGVPSIGRVRDWNFHFDPYIKKIDQPATSGCFHSLEEEWEWIRQVEWPLYKESEPDPLYYISLPTYIARHGQESDRIHKKFLKARDRLAKLFCERKLSEVIAEEASKK